MGIQLEKAFDEAVRDINSELWASVVGLNQVERIAKWIAPLDGTNHEKALLSAFPMVRPRLLKNLRLTNKNLSSDLATVSRSATRWIFAYFTIVVRSVAENNVRNRVRDLAAAHPTFRAALKKRAKRAGRPKGQVIDAVAQEICRGKHDWFVAHLPASLTYDGTSGQLDQRLKRYNRVRNTIAHRLLEKKRSRAISADRWITVTKTLQELMRRLP